MRTIRLRKLVALSAFVVFMIFDGVAMTARAQSNTSPTAYNVNYSFDEVRTDYLGASVQSNGASVGSIPIGSNTFSATAGSCEIYSSLPFLVDGSGNQISNSQIDTTNSPILSTVNINGTWIQYREYHYAFDVLAYTTMLLPSLTEDTMAMPGWSNGDNPQSGTLGSSGSDDLISTQNGGGPLLVLQEIAPAGVINNNGDWAYPLSSCISLAEYYATTPSWDKYATSGWLTHDLGWTQALYYTTPSLNYQNALNTIGGAHPLIVTPKIGISVVPFLHNTVTVNNTNCKIYSAILSIQCTKLEYGVVANAFASDAKDFSQSIAGNQPSSPSSSQTGSTPQATSKSAAGTDGISYEGSVIVEGTHTAPLTYTNEGVQTGVPLAMYTPQTGNPVTAPTATSLELIQNAPQEVYVQPTYTLQPDYEITTQTVAGNGHWVQYTNPWVKQVLCLNNGYVYPQAPVVDSPKQWTIQPVVEVNLQNTFVINRFVANIVVSANVNITKPLSSSGKELSAPTYAGNNNQNGVGAYNVTTHVNTPPPFSTADWLSNLASWISSPGGVIVIVLIIVAVIAVVILIKGGFHLGGGRGGISAKDLLKSQAQIARINAPRTAPFLPEKQKPEEPPPGLPSSALMDGTPKKCKEDGRTSKKGGSTAPSSRVSKYRNKKTITRD